jgi:hypothetical protein
MMDVYRRDVTQIADSANFFTNMANGLDGLTNIVSVYEVELGDPDIVHAVHDMANNWWVERDRLSKELRSAGTALTHVADTYDQVESTIIASTDTTHGTST